jgi:hypothetical protein
MNLRLFLAGLAIGSAGAWYLLPKPSVQTDTQVKVEYRVRTVERTVTRPDGTTETIKQIDDTTVKNVLNSTTVYAKPNWQIGVSAGGEVLDFRPVYGAMVQRRIIGPIFAGAYARTNAEIGLLVTMEF